MFFQELFILPFAPSEIPRQKVIHIDRIISPFFEIEYFLNFLVPLFLNKSVLSIPVFKSVDFPTKQVERST